MSQRTNSQKEAMTQVHRSYAFLLYNRAESKLQEVDIYKARPSSPLLNPRPMSGASNTVNLASNKED